MVYARLAEIVYSEGGYDEILQGVCDAARQLVDGCDHSSIMLRRSEGFVTVASSDEVGSMIDAIERAVHEGPCLDAIEDNPIQLDTDLTKSTWPRLAARVLVETPVRGAAGFRLLVGGNKVGALNIFSDTAGALTAESVNQGSILASFVSVALTAAAEQREAETLRTGLASNREIGKAIGLLMAFHKIDDQAAFALLRKTSQDLNMRLTEVARQVVDHHNTRPLDAP
nr:GAF and ANTAR domain-containing protein [Microlunatus panaciterrae]